MLRTHFQTGANFTSLLNVGLIGISLPFLTGEWPDQPIGFGPTISRYFFLALFGLLLAILLKVCRDSEVKDVLGESLCWGDTEA